MTNTMTCYLLPYMSVALHALDSSTFPTMKTSTKEILLAFEHTYSPQLVNQKQWYFLILQLNHNLNALSTTR